MRSPKSLKSAPIVCSVRLRASTVAATSPGLFDPSRRMSFANLPATGARSVTMVRLDLVLRAEIRDCVVHLLLERVLELRHLLRWVIRQVGRDDEVDVIARAVAIAARLLFDLGVERQPVEIAVARELALFLRYKAVIAGI